jgi:hypothetical protein
VVKTTGSKLKSSKDDWITVLVHFNGLSLSARNLSSWRVMSVIDNGAKFELDASISPCEVIQVAFSARNSYWKWVITFLRWREMLAFF